MGHGGDRYRNRIRLDFSVNLNPLGQPAILREAMEKAVGDTVFYPDPHQEAGRNAAAELYGALLCCPISPEQILPGNGASELITAVFHGLCPRRVLIAGPCFTGYLRAAQALAGRCSMDLILTDEAALFQANDTLAAGIRPDTELVVLTSPGNPGGKLIDPEFLQRLLQYTKERRIPVLLDECFHGFTGRNEESGLKLLSEYPQLMVLRAFTKIFSLPGLRLGLLFTGDPRIRRKVADALPEWNLSSFAEAVLRTAGEKKEEIGTFLGDTAREVRSLREDMMMTLRQEGIEVYPSDTVFLLTRGMGGLVSLLLRRGILVRDCGDMMSPDGEYVRLAVRPREEQLQLFGEIRRLRAGLSLPIERDQ